MKHSLFHTDGASVIAPFAKEKQGDLIIKCILFLISPFLSFFYSLRTMDRKSSYICFFLFAVFWCMIQCPTTDELSTDTSRNRLIFDKIAEDQDLTLPELYIMSDGGKAIYTLLFFKAVSRFTDNYHWFIVISGCLISFFQLKSFRFFTSSPYFSNGWKAVVLACMFVMHAPLYWAGAVRFILAAWIAIYATLQIWMNEDKRYWLLLLIFPSLIHFSFFAYSIIFVIASLFGKKEDLWIVLLPLSFVFQIFATALYEYLASIQNILPGFIFGNLGSEEFMKGDAERIENLGLAARIIGLYVAPFFPTIIALFFYYNRSQIIKKSEVGYRVFQLTMVLTFFFNVLSVIPDLGRRFGWLMYSYYAIVMAYCFLNKKYTWVYLVYLFSASVYLYGDIRSKWFLLNDLSDWVTNPFTLIYNYLINPTK